MRSDTQPADHDSTAHRVGWRALHPSCPHTTERHQSRGSGVQASIPTAAAESATFVLAIASIHPTPSNQVGTVLAQLFRSCPAGGSVIVTARSGTNTAGCGIARPQAHRATLSDAAAVRFEIADPTAHVKSDGGRPTATRRRVALRG